MRDKTMKVLKGGVGSITPMHAREFDRLNRLSVSKKLRVIAILADYLERGGDMEEVLDRLDYECTLGLWTSDRLIWLSLNVFPKELAALMVQLAQSISAEFK
jgi:hypothetical protein